ncbi:MAG TPA: SIS domain-containing protein [Clostridia bacterium]
MTIMESEIFQQSDVLKNCLNYNKQTLNDLVKTLKEKNIENVVVAARGSSDNASNYFKYVFESLAGLPVALAAPSINTLYNTKLSLKHSLVIGVSQSGAAEDVMAVINNAKESGAVTVCITNNLESKMAKLADFHLYCNADKERSVAATKTFTSQMYLLANLAAYYAENEEVKAELESVPENLNKIFALKENIAVLSEKYKNMSSLIVLARGTNYAIAQETALKIQETTYINARAYAASDFHHGPFAIVDDKSTVMLIAPKGLSQNDMVEMKDKLLGVDAKVIVMTNDQTIAQGATDTMLLPVEGSDYVMPFYNVVASQLWACYMSVARGLNPDAPRGLKKVTITK